MNRQKDLLKDLFLHISKNSWMCLAAGIITGIITHLYMLTNKLPNWDDLTAFGSYGVGAENGRWMIPILHVLGGEWSVPALNGMLAIILISIATCFILEALELKTVTSAIIFPFLMMTFPSIACTMTFMYLVDVYAMGLLFGCAGAWFVRKYKYGWIPGVALLVMCTAVYQSYICFAAGILVLALVFDLLRKKNFDDVIKKGIVSLGSLIGSLGIYLILSKYVIGGLQEYKGLDKMGEINLLKIPRLIGRAYKRILEFFVIEPWGYVSEVGRIVNLFVVAIIVVGFFLLLWYLKVFKEKNRAALLCVLIILFPLALGAIYVMAEDANSTLLLIHQYVLIYLVPLGFWEIFAENSCFNEASRQKLKLLVGTMILSALFLVGYDNYVLTNNAYFRMDIAFTRIHSFYERLYIRVAEEEGYQYGDRIAILGDWWPERNILSAYGMDIERYEEMEGVAMENGLFTTGIRNNFLKIYLGVEFDEKLSIERMLELMKTDEFKEMTAYPSDGCVRKMDDIWVIKVAD